MSSSTGESGLNTLRGTQSIASLTKSQESVKAALGKSIGTSDENYVSAPRGSEGVVTCDSVRRTLTRFYLYKIIVEKAVYVLFWPAMVILMYLSLVYFQDSDNNFFVVDGVINAFCGDEWEFEFSRISSIVQQQYYFF